jgi:hypothetical protein
MQLRTFKNILSTVESLSIQLPNGSMIPAHFHITELGLITRHFIDCGGTVRLQKAANFQIWVAHDTEHRLTPLKLLGIIRKAEKTLALPDDIELEVEYQQGTIGKYHLNFADGRFQLVQTQTACLAEDACGIPETQRSGFMSLESFTRQATEICCSPETGCC